MQVFNRHVSGRGLTVFGLETMVISGSIFVAAAVHGSLDAAAASMWRILFITALCELCFYYNDLYDLTVVHTKNALVVHLLQASGAVAIVLAALSIVAPGLLEGHGTFMTALCVLLVAVPAWRLAFDGLAGAPPLEERVLIVGTGSSARTVAREIESQHDFAYRLVGIIEPSELTTSLSKRDVDRIVVSLDDRRGTLPIRELLQAKLSGIRVEDAPTTYERITGKILIDGLKPSWFVFSDGFHASRITRALKRSADVVLAAFGILLGAPFMLATAIAVRLESPGPVLYCQERVGEGGRTFTLCKFRSMRIDAENGTPIWAKEKDDRVTRIGRFIRLTRLDELPQLWNVLRGDMSFVGPRPERPFFVQQLAEAIPFYNERHVVKPGVTGWAQVKYRYGSSVEDAMEKLRYDLYYIKHQSILFDLSIVVDTVKVIVSAKGAK